GKLRLYSVLIGMTVGYVLSLVTGLMSPVQLNEALAVPWFDLPGFEGMWSFSFCWSLLPTFAIFSIFGALKSVGNLILWEKVNDDQWSRPDIKRIGDGLMADALCVTASGMLGGMASDTSASNVSLSSASGATSRWIGFAAGALFAILGFSPK